MTSEPRRRDETGLRLALVRFYNTQVAWRLRRLGVLALYDRVFRRRAVKDNPKTRWFYHLPYYIPTGDHFDADYYWIDAWGCGCCVRKMGVCSISEWSRETEEWLGSDKARIVYSAPDGRRYILYFDGPAEIAPTRYPDGTFAITAFKRLDCYPKDADAHEDETLSWAAAVPSLPPSEEPTRDE